jgi:hypothetical protein
MRAASPRHGLETTADEDLNQAFPCSLARRALIRLNDLCETPLASSQRLNPNCFSSPASNDGEAQAKESSMTIVREALKAKIKPR